MKKVITTAVFVYLTLMVSSIIAQKIEKTITPDTNEKITAITASENYVAIRLENESKHQKKVILYDMEGLQKQEVSIEFSNAFIIKAEPIEELNLFLVIFSGWEEDKGVKGSSDIITAYNLTDGSVVWQTESNAAFYEISPNKKRMITGANAHDRTTVFQIINLVDGSLDTPTSVNMPLRAAAWYDNENIAILSTKHEITSKAQDYLDPTREEIMKLSKEMTTLKKDFKSGTVTDEIFNIEMEKLLKKKEILAIQLKEGKRKKSRKAFYKSLTLQIYNIKTQSIELEQLMYGELEKPLKTCSNSIYSVLNCDRKGNTYIGCMEESEELRGKQLNYFIKLDKQLKQVWSSKKGTYRGLSKLVINDEFNFYYSMNGKYKIIDNDSGKILDEEKAKKEIDNLSELEFTELSRSGLNHKYRHVKFDSKDNSVKLLSKEQ